MNAATKTISIDGRQFALDQLSAEARSLLESLQAVDQEMARLQMQQAICQTARNAYLQALRNALPADANVTSASAGDAPA